MKIERNLHEGAQQRLVALSVQLKFARTMLERDPEKAGTLLDQVEHAAGGALNDPAISRAGSTTAALRAQAGRRHLRSPSAATTSVAIGRSSKPRSFLHVGGLNNVAKYANAPGASVELRQTDGRLSFTVTDEASGSTLRQRTTAPVIRAWPTASTRSAGALTVQSAPGNHGDRIRPGLARRGLPR